MKKIAFVLLLVLSFACNKQDKQVAEKSSEKTEVVKEKIKALTVDVKLTTNKADDFKLSLNNVIVNKVQKKNIQVIQKISAEKTNNISANFGQDNISKTLILNLGNKAEKEVVIENITITYGDKKLTASSSELQKYFNLNKFVSLDENTNALLTKKIDGKHSPSLILKPAAYKALIK